MASQTERTRDYSEGDAVTATNEHYIGDYEYDYSRCHGLKLFLDGRCQHQKDHNKEWQRALENGVEAGTLCFVDRAGSTVGIQWDCGAMVSYHGKEELQKLRILDCAATGKLIQSVCHCTL